MAEETDGVREAFDDALRIALTVATQMGERVARLREQFARQREARAVQTNRELETRFEAERGAMRASLLSLEQAGWWERATVTDIANARETAVSWSDYDGVAREANDKIEREVRDRYGIDVSRPGADPAEVAEALRTAESEHAQAVAQRERDEQDLAASDLLLLAADRRDRESMQASSDQRAIVPTYDSAQRREALAASLVGIVDQKAVDARLLADGENARHPREAVHGRRASSPTLTRATPGLKHQVKDRELGR
jgi:hypothetical protein